MRKTVLLSYNPKEHCSQAFLEKFQPGELIHYFPEATKPSLICAYKEDQLLFHHGSPDYDLIRTHADNGAHIIVNEESYIDDLITFASKHSDITTAYDDMENYKALFLKAETKRHLKSKNIRAPHLIDSITDIKDNKTYMMKPNLAAGAQGARVLKGYQLKDIYTTTENISDYCIEEYIEGTIYHFDVFVYKNEIFSIGCGKYRVPPINFYQHQEVSSILLPSTSPEWHIIESYIFEILLSFNSLPGGVLHTEVCISDTDNLPYLIEINPRTPGGKVYYAYDRMYNINLHDLHFWAQADVDFEVPSFRQPKAYYAWAYFPSQIGKVRSLNPFIPQHGSEIMMSEYFSAPGDTTTSIKSFRDKDYCLVIAHNNFDHLNKDFQTFKTFKPANYEQ
ncbi:ATP-grasp domain-containing protein [Vibrio rhizosphaerae]|uniref:ATP-grasp domain-containing protein n=1 Tax=Vibrio rhizosphaerae TaxID=398736 RepID=A0ABU4IRZ6_9VIBR|nr:ATP-grasp domain-containing protein [Vibrio rhizosphaerae]MDW6092140.1 ATP-grasp domain-containing protein [Vibrio rhizosphaerae]